MDDTELTRMAIKEIEREMDERKAQEPTPQLQDKRLIHKTNKRFLHRTIKSVLTHNKRKEKRSQENCRLKLKELDKKCSNSVRNDRKRKQRLQRERSYSSSTETDDAEDYNTKRHRRIEVQKRAENHEIHTEAYQNEENMLQNWINYANYTCNQMLNYQNLIAAASALKQRTEQDDDVQVTISDDEENEIILLTPENASLNSMLLSSDSDEVDERGVLTIDLSSDKSKNKHDTNITENVERTSTDDDNEGHISVSSQAVITCSTSSEPELDENNKMETGETHVTIDLSDD